jgi:hypothetical protein
MLAAAACAYNEGPPPPELTLAWQCKRWGTLPEPGGLRDQIAGEMERMAAAQNAYDAVRGSLASGDHARWAAVNPGLDKLLGWILTERANGS